MQAVPVPGLFRGLEALIPLNSMKIQQVVSLLEGNLDIRFFMNSLKFRFHSYKKNFLIRILCLE